MNLLGQIEASALGAWIRESEWGYPIVLISHTVGMALVVGGVMAFAIRILFLKPAVQVAWFDLIFKLAWIGFAINLASGVILFTGAAQRFAAHPAFQIKLSALAIGALLIRILARRAETHPVVEKFDARSRVLAGASILLWFGAIAAGRLMAYIR